MDHPESGSDQNLPPPPPRRPGVVPRTVADVTGASSSGASSSRVADEHQPPESGSDPNLPPPPPRRPGVVPRTLADVTGASSSGGADEHQPPEKRLKETAVQKYSQMKRPGFGSRGRRIDLVCNHFKVTFRPSQSIFQYNVEIDPPTKSVVNRKVMAALNAAYGQEFLKGKLFAYDGEKSLFVVGSLPTKESEFPVLLEDDHGRRRDGGNEQGSAGSLPEASSRTGRQFVVKISHVATVDMKSIDAVLRGERDDKVQDALRVLDIMLREHAAKKSYLLLKDSYFHDSLGDVQKIGDGVALWRGYHVSFRPTSGGLSLNFDLATTLVIDPTSVQKFMEDQLNKKIGSFRQEDWVKAKRILKGILIKTYSGRKHKISGFSPETCANQTFPKRVKDGAGIPTDEKEDITVLKYFETHRNVRLKYPQYPALDVGRPNKPIYLPLELCDILPGQRYKRSLTTIQRQKQIDITRQGPEGRRRLIEQGMAINKFNDDELVTEFRVNIDQNMKSVSGRVLDSPKLLFGRNVEDTPRLGRWNFGAKLTANHSPDLHQVEQTALFCAMCRQFQTMKDPVEIPNWVVARFRGGRFNAHLDARQIATEMKNVCGQKGMRLGEFVVVEEEMQMPNYPPQERVNAMFLKLKEHLVKFKNPKDVERPFILAILPEKSPDLYIPFKRKFEVEYGSLGIVTQCIVPPRGLVNPKYLTSVSLKINLKVHLRSILVLLLPHVARKSGSVQSREHFDAFKVSDRPILVSVLNKDDDITLLSPFVVSLDPQQRGGYNSWLSSEEQRTLPKVSQVPTIIFGLDVSHGSPGDPRSPSVAAAVATVDWPRVSRFTTSIRAQAPMLEMIQGLYEPPKQGMVRELLLNFYTSGRKKPEQILIFRDGVSESQFDQVLQKELVDFKLACVSLEPDYNPKITMIVVQKRHHTRFFPARGGGNVVPGTIVDRDPCHPGNNDFYLVSHQGIIGTSRPTHYHVLYDEINFTPDELQHLTNSLCYSYTRCTSAVSVVAPVYYAHLAAQHCRNFVVEKYDDSGSESSTLMSVKIEKATKDSFPSSLMRKTMFYA